MFQYNSYWFQTLSCLAPIYRSGWSREIATMVIAENRDPHNSIAYIIACNKDYITVV